MVGFYKGVLQLFFNLFANAVFQSVVFWIVAVFFFYYICKWLTSGGNRT